MKWETLHYLSQILPFMMYLIVPLWGNYLLVLFVEHEEEGDLFGTATLQAQQNRWQLAPAN